MFRMGVVNFCFRFFFVDTSRSEYMFLDLLSVLDFRVRRMIEWFLYSG